MDDIQTEAVALAEVKRELSKFSASPYQQTIFDFIKMGRGDGIVSAVAGSGKTTTLVQGAKLIGSQSSIFLAFNKHIAEATQIKLAGTNMQSKTIHSVGNSALFKAYGRLQLDDNKYREIAERRILEAFPNIDPNDSFSVGTLRSYVTMACKIIDLSRMTLSRTAEEIEAMISERAIDFGELEPEVVDTIISVVRPSINEGVKIAQTAKIIDFSDMIFIPVILKLPIWKYQWVFIDEAQDLNACQRELVLMLRANGGRMLFVGDPLQAIMAFSGADANSYWKIKDVTNATELPLSICYRCPTSHLDMARRIVPQIEARPDAEVGKIINIDRDHVTENVQEGDLIICRTTAPLISHCISLIRNRIPARVRGRDVADMLIKKAREIAKRGKWNEFPRLLDEYRSHQIQILESKKNPSETQIQLVNDLCEALEVCYSEFCPTDLRDMVSQIESIFSEERASVWLSSIHRAKGLEADRVFILDYDRLPMVWKKQSAEQKQQETNLQYVALTRSKSILYLVKGGKSC